MKMTKESYNYIVQQFEKFKDEIIKHKEYLINNAKYSSLEARLGFDCYYSNAIISKEFKQELRENEDLKDSHLQTALVKALKTLNIV